MNKRSSAMQLKFMWTVSVWTKTLDSILVRLVAWVLQLLMLPPHLHKVPCRVPVAICLLLLTVEVHSVLLWVGPAFPLHTVPLVEAMVRDTQAGVMRVGVMQVEATEVMGLMVPALRLTVPLRQHTRLQALRTHRLRLPTPLQARHIRPPAQPTPQRRQLIVQLLLRTLRQVLHIHRHHQHTPRPARHTLQHLRPIPQRVLHTHRHHRRILPRVQHTRQLHQHTPLQVQHIRRLLRHIHPLLRPTRQRHLHILQPVRPIRRRLRHTLRQAQPIRQLLQPTALPRHRKIRMIRARTRRRHLGHNLWIMERNNII
mmetsp:Transcript_12432/g.36626  ORF Transcript_12432/g.36626 Transcript_12432/m.36626 type:complete len:313 (-) Transcript_12432:250-1188(-)